MIENPYKYMGPLDPAVDKLVCSSRSKEVNRVVEGIRRGEYWEILGPRQIGKTTFLRQIESVFPDAYYLFFNFEMAPSSEKEFYEGLKDRFVEKIPCKTGKDHKEGWKVSDPALKFYNFLKRFKPKKEKRIVLFFDEIEAIPHCEDFLRLWRKVYSERYQLEELKRYSIVMTGNVRLMELTRGPNSPFNIANTFLIKDFSDEETEKIIDVPFNKLNIEIKQNAKKKLISDISGHPQMLQHACYYLIETAATQNRNIKERDIEDAIEHLLKSNSSLSRLKQDLEADSNLKNLIREILKGKRKPYFPYIEFSISGSGPIVEKNRFCAIRNNVYKKFLEEIIEQERISKPGALKRFWNWLFGRKSTEAELDGKLDRELDRRHSDDFLLIEKASKDEFFDTDKGKKGALPCALKQLRVKDYYGIIDTEISGIPVDTRWIFLTGDNGYGKTSVLQALAIGLYGGRDGDTILADEKSKIAVEIHDHGGNRVNNLWHPTFKPFTNFAAYGSSRLEMQGLRQRQSEKEIQEKSAKTYGLFNPSNILLNIEYDLLIWYLAKDPKFEIVKKTLLSLLPYIEDIKIVDRKVVYIEKEMMGNGQTYDPLPFEKLASGYRNIIAMVGDMLIRLFKEQPEAKNPKGLCGIVIIDELDLHLFPRWQRELPGMLSSVFPNVQFIASTHSVLPFLGAPEKSVFLKVTRNKKQGIQIERIDINIKNLLPNSILTSPIFDLEGEEITHKNKESIFTVRTEDDYKKILKNDKIKKRLQEFEDSKEDFPDDLFE
jgi:predicted AAA+ superfamily ATPase/predicted ATPase